MSRPTSLPAALAALALAAGCPAPIESSPPECDGVAPLSFTVEPSAVRAGAFVQLVATGGSGVYAFGVSEGGSGGEVRGARFIAGPTPATDQLYVKDSVCQSEATATLEVVAAFAIAPTRGVIKPGTSFEIATAGLIGAPELTLVRSDSGATLEGARYTAGPNTGVDLVRVRDDRTGDEALLQLEVRPDAHFRSAPERVAIPAGGTVSLVTADGTNAVSWAKVGSGPGVLEGNALSTERHDQGAVVLEATDRFTGEKARVTVRLLDELVRPTIAHGRITDVASLVTADFDGDGIDDLAVGHGESSLARPTGGAVFIFKGAAGGLPSEPTWTLTGTSDTAAFGTALAAGDLDGDGHAELVVSAPGDDVTLSESGALHFFRWGAEGPVAMRDPLSGVGRGRFGTAFALGDVDADGDLDLVVGAPTADLAGTTAARGVVDVFLLDPSKPIPSVPSLRLGGSDLAADGTTRSFAGVQLGRALALGDLDGDGTLDLAALGTVNHSAENGTRSQPAISVFLSRGGTSPYRETPDAYVLASNAADADEGSWRLGFLAGEGARPATLLVTVDEADAPDLSASGGGPAATDAGAAYLFDLAALLPAPAGAPPPKPTQLTGDDAWARLYGHVANARAGRAFTVLDVGGAPGPELLLGAPLVQRPGATAAENARLAGAILAWPLSSLAPGAVSNVPAELLYGSRANDCLGVALGTWNVGAGETLVSMAGRASTAEGHFTGRIDQYERGDGFANWTRRSAAVPAMPAAEDFGAAVALGRGVDGHALALVGAPSVWGPGVNGDGSEASAGQGQLFDSRRPTDPLLVSEGAAWPRIRGGRRLGSDVAFTDFDGDGRADLLVGAPNHSVAATGSSELSSNYEVLRPECSQTSSYTPGGVQVFLAEANGGWRSAYRIWGEREHTAGCTGTGSSCRRLQLGRELAGGLDFDGDGRDDVAALRTNGLDVFLGRPPDPSATGKLTMLCGAAYSTGYLPQQTSGLTALGDLNGDGCDELGYRYGDSRRSKYVVLFGFSAAGGRCGGRTTASQVEIVGDADAMLNPLGIGAASANAGALRGDGKRYLALSATAFPVDGVAQESVVLIDLAQIVARRPASGSTSVGLLGDGLTPAAFALRLRHPGFGSALVGGVDLTGDGVPDLAVGAPGATVASEGGGAVFVFSGVGQPEHRWEPWLLLAGEHTARSRFGNDLAVLPGTDAAPPVLGVGAVDSYRHGSRNGAAFLLPLAF